MSLKKKIILSVLIVMIIGVTLLYTIYKNKQKEMREIIKDPALDYFVNYMSSNSSSSAYKVTLKMLNEVGTYDLTGLENCDENKTYAVVNISFVDGSVKDTDVVLECKIF